MQSMKNTNQSINQSINQSCLLAALKNSAVRSPPNWHQLTNSWFEISFSFKPCKVSCGDGYKLGQQLSQCLLIYLSSLTKSESEGSSSKNLMMRQARLDTNTFWRDLQLFCPKVDFQPLFSASVAKPADSNFLLYHTLLALFFSS